MDSSALKGHVRDGSGGRMEAMIQGYIGPSQSAPMIQAQKVTSLDFPNGHPK
jgi:hypothetical protein